MLKEVNNEVITSTAQTEHAAAMQGRMLKGRRIIWLIFTFFKRNPKMGMTYSVTDRAELEWMGDKQIHKFLLMWRLVLDQMQTTISEDGLTEIFTQRMEKSVVLKEDIAHFYRMDDGHGNKDHDFLITPMENYMDLERYSTNRANDLHSMLSQVNREARAGAPSIIDQPGGNGPSEVSEKRKKKRQERKARAAAKAAAAPAPTPTGKGKGEGK